MFGLCVHPNISISRTPLREVLQIWYKRLLDPKDGLITSCMVKDHCHR